VRRAFHGVLLGVCVLQGCKSHPPNTSPPPEHQILLQSEPIPVRDPQPAKGFWQELSEQKVRDRLTSQRTFAHFYRVDASGQLRVFPAAVTAEKGEYIYIHDYHLFESPSDKETVGVAVRLYARIYATQAGVTLGTLEAVGAEVRKGRASGQLSVEVHGLRNAGVLPPLSLTIDEQSIIRAKLAHEQMWEKVRDTTTGLRPLVIARTESPPRTDAVVAVAWARWEAQRVGAFGSGAKAVASQGCFADRVRIEWKTDPEWERYDLYRSTTRGELGGDPIAQFKAVRGEVTLVHDDLSADRGTVYWYTVNAVSTGPNDAYNRDLSERGYLVGYSQE
jgi:hypothetical protein